MTESIHREMPLTIVVIGASGDLSQRKILPALFALACRSLIPEPFRVVGFARTAMTHGEFRARAMENLTCRYTPKSDCGAKMDRFLERCFYFAGQYDSTDSLLDLHRFLRELERTPISRRMYYMATPPDVFTSVVQSIGDAGMATCDAGGDCWSRIVVEKPFGRDRESSDSLVKVMARVFPEEQTYRIDHYLGKDVVQNLMVLRFANTIFEPVWNRRYVHSVHILWSEEIGIGSRGRYFDAYGIIRDVIQNHLMQVLALTAMEPPARLDSTSVRDAKVRLLRSIPPLCAADILTGQYRGVEHDGRHMPDYLAETHVPPGSRTPTFAAVRLKVNNPRWQGVPFVIVAGKAMNQWRNEIVVRFKPLDNNLFCDVAPCLESNELRIRIQPDEALVLRITNKVPDLGMRLAVTNLDLRYSDAFDIEIPGAYESLLLDVIRGDRSLFIRADELEAAWNVYTPALHELDEQQIKPQLYDFGSSGPATVESFIRGNESAAAPA